jgi:hypothetical protein
MGHPDPPAVEQVAFLEAARLADPRLLPEHETLVLHWLRDVYYRQGLVAQVLRGELMPVIIDARVEFQRPLPGLEVRQCPR